MTLPSRRELAASSGLATLGLAMLVFVAAGPSIVRSFGYGVFVPALVASGFLTIAASRLAKAVEARIGLIIVLGFAIAMRLTLVGEEPFLSTEES